MLCGPCTPAASRENKHRRDKSTGQTERNSQVEVFTSDDDGVGHFGGVNDTGKDTSSDGNVTGEGALLVDVSSVDGL